MMTTGRIAYILTPLLLSSVLASCRRNDANATAAPAASTIATAAPAADALQFPEGVIAPNAVPRNPAPPAAAPAQPIAQPTTQPIAQQTGITRDLGPIDFAPGATAASVSNFLAPESTDRYTFDATAGQPATVRVDSQTGQIQLALIGPDGRALRLDSSSWVGTLPLDGTYRLQVVNRSIASQYTVNLDIQPGGAQVFNRGAIDFASGSTSTSVDGFLNPQNTDRYTFDAVAGQPTNLNILSETGQVLLTLIDPNGNPIVRSQSGASSWAGTLPATGTYQLNVVNPSSASSYKINLSITP